MTTKEKLFTIKDNLIQLIFLHHKILISVLGFFLLCWFFVAFFFAQENSGTTDAALELEQLTTNIRRYYQNRPDYWGLSTQMVLDKNICPHKMLKNNRLIGYFGNPILIGNGPDADVLMPGARNFDIIYKELNEKQCIGLAAFKFSQKFWLGVTGISIINDKYNQFFTWDDKENGLPIQKNTAKNICKGNNTIIWHCEQ